MSDAALKLVDLRKGFDAGQGRLEVLRGATVEVARGEVIALLGPSGAGKSTLLHIAGLLETADSGEIVLAGKSCAKLSDSERTAIRRETVGFVYQFHNLLPEFSATDNVALPQMVAGKSQSDARARARELLSRLGLGQRLEHYPYRRRGVRRTAAGRPRRWRRRAHRHPQRRARRPHGPADIAAQRDDRGGVSLSTKSSPVPTDSGWCWPVNALSCGSSPLHP